MLLLPWKSRLISNGDSVAGREQMSACVRCEGVWIDGGLGWRAALLLDQRENTGRGCNS